MALLDIAVAVALRKYALAADRDTDADGGVRLVLLARVEPCIENAERGVDLRVDRRRWHRPRAPALLPAAVF